VEQYFPIVLIALFAVVLFVLPARQRKRIQAKAQALQESLDIGTPVMTTSGVHGTVAAIGDTTVDLEIAPGVVVTFARPAEELLYMAMEDFRVDVVVGKGPGATAIPLEISPFTLVGATTRAGLLTGPLRDRFGFVGQMEFYEPAELQQVLRRSAALLGVELSEDGSAEIAGRSRGTPRIANRLLRRVRDFAEVEADGRVTREVAQAALAVYDVDDLGLDRLDRAVLEALVVRFGGGPVGVATLAVAVGEEPNTVEEVCEPFLVRAGLLARTARGRVATEAAWHHLGQPLPRGGALLGGAGGAISGLPGAPSTPGASSEPLFGA
jgi:Holliday junction DNA helicase RuvB